MKGFKQHPIRRREIKSLPRMRHIQEGSVLEREKQRTVAMGFTADIIAQINEDRDEEYDHKRRLD